MNRISSVTSITSLSDLVMPSNSDSRQLSQNQSNSNITNNASAVFLENSILFQELKDHLKERQCTTSASIHAETQKFMKLHHNRETSAASSAGDAETRDWASTSVLEESCHSRNNTGSRRRHRRASDGNVQLQKLKRQQQEQQQGSSVNRFRRAVSLGFTRRMSNAFSVTSTTGDLSNSHHSSGASLSFLNNSSNHNSSSTIMNLAGDREEEYLSASTKSESRTAAASYYNSSSLSSHSTSSDVASHNNVHHRHTRRSTMDTIASTTSTDSNGNNGRSGEYDDDYENSAPNDSSRRRSCLARLPSQDRVVLTDDPLNPDVTKILDNTLGYEETLPLPTTATTVTVNNQEQTQVEIENLPDFYQNEYHQAQAQVEYEQKEEAPRTPPRRQRTRRRGSCVTTMLQQKPPEFAPDSIACPETPSYDNYQAESQGQEGGESPSYYYGNQHEQQQEQQMADEEETSPPRRGRRTVRRRSCVTTMMQQQPPQFPSSSTASSDYAPPPVTELDSAEQLEQQAHDDEEEKERQELYPSSSPTEPPSSSSQQEHEDPPRSRGGRTQRRGSCVTSMMHQQPPIITKDCDKPLVETISLVPSTLDHDVQYGEVHHPQEKEDTTPPQRKGRRPVRRGSHVGSYKPPSKSEERDSMIILGEELGELLVNFGNYSSDDDTDSKGDGSSESNDSNPVQGSTGTSTSSWVEEDDITENTNEEDGLLCGFPSRVRKTKAVHHKNDHAFAA